MTHSAATRAGADPIAQIVSSLALCTNGAKVKNKNANGLLIQKHTFSQGLKRLGGVGLAAGCGGEGEKGGKLPSFRLVSKKIVSPYTKGCVLVVFLYSTTTMNFWQQLPKPFLTVAPMADVTDAAFRRMIAKYSAHTRADGAHGGADVTWTEFVAADGIVRATEEGKKKLMADLIYSNEERPIVAQLFTRHPEHMEYTAKLCLELGFDGIDINMGCPAGAIIDQGCGAAMIRTPEIAVEVIRAAKRGAKSDEGGIPVSVKTRLGYNTDQVEDWIPVILREQPAALTVHTRTRKEMSKVPARWDRLERVVELRNELSPETLIIGNGDVLTRADGLAKAARHGVDGAMVGRALFGNPWFFHPTRQLPTRLTALPTHGVDRDTIMTSDTTNQTVEYVTLEERLQVMLEHTYLFCELLPHKNFAVMKKHYKAYVGGFPGAAEFRARLMEQDSPEAVEAEVAQFLASHQKSSIV